MPRAWRDRLPGAAVPLALAALYAPIGLHSLSVWASYPELSFGFLAPVVVGLLLWMRRAELRRSVGAGSQYGLLLLVPGLVVLVAASYQDVNPVKGLSLIPTALGTLVFLYGFAMARVTAAPTILLAGSFSVYKSLLSALGFKLQELTAVGASAIVAGVGVPVHRADIDIFVGRMHFTVVQGCSGMDSLLALLGLGLLVVSVLDLPLLIRPLLLLATVPIALAANTARVVAVLLLSGPVGDAVTRAPLHELLSGSVFLVAIVMFWLFVLALRCVPRQLAALSL